MLCITRAFPFTTPLNASTLVARWQGLKKALEVVKKYSAMAWVNQPRSAINRESYVRYKNIMSRIKSIQGRSLVLICLALVTACVLSACGGGSNATGEVTAPDLKLTALTVEGHDIAFSADKRSGYVVSVDQPVNTAVFTATAAEGVTLTYSLRSVVNPTTTLAGIELESGAATSIDLDEGDNLLTIRITSEDTSVAVTYSVSFHRVSSLAKLNGIAFFNDFDGSLADTNFLVPISPTFDSATSTYTASVSSYACSLRTRLVTNDRRSSATINGESIGHLQSSSFPLVEGDNNVDVVVTSEDGVNTEAYNFTFTRATMTDEERAANPRLIDLNLSGGEINFACGVTSYGAVVSYDDQTVTLTAVPEIDGITMTLAKVDDDGEVPDGDAQPLNSPIELTLDEGLNGYVLITTATDGSTELTYNLTINRISRNIVNVTTAEELQTALKNAAPRDEIRVAEGTYVGVASDEASGNVNAHFYSAQSGTEDNRIRLVGQGSGSILSGTDTAANAVLQLAGEHWFVSNLAVSNAQTGVVLDAASNNELYSLDVNTVGAQSIVVRNGSSDNIIQASRFSETAKAIVIGSDSEQWLSAPGGAGMYNEADLNNIVRSNLFASNITAESVEINEGAEGTLVEYNFFNSGSLSGEAGADSLVLVQGNNSTVRFNTFTHTDDANLDAVVEVQPASAAWQTADWGMDTNVNDNIMLLNGMDIVGVNAGAENTVQVVNNTRDGELTISYVGAAIDTTSLASPVFELRTADVADQCLGLDEQDGVNYMRVLTCDSSAAQRWSFLRDSEGFVRIQNVGTPELFARPVSGFTSRCGASSADSFVYGGVSTEGFLQRWLPNFRANNLYLLNKENTGFAITSGSATAAVDSYIIACPATYTTNQRLSLVEVN